MGEKPAKHDIDRIDTNGDYSPENCRWLPRKENQRNRRNNVYVTRNGERRLLVEWAEILGISYGTLWSRYKRGWNDDMILSPLFR